MGQGGADECVCGGDPLQPRSKPTHNTGSCRRLLCVSLLPRHHASTPIQEMEHLYGEIQTEKQAVGGSRLPAAFVTFK